MRGQARCQGVNKGGAQENRLEQLAAHVQRNLRQRGIGVFKAMNIREEQLHKERRDDENNAAVHRSKKNRFRDHPCGVRGLFRQRGHRVEAEKREADNRRAGNNRDQMRILADKRLQRPDGPHPLAFVQPLHHQNDKHHHDRNLHQHEQGVEVGHQVNAFQVRGGQNGDKGDHPHPWRHLREQRREIDLRQQDVDHRQKQIIEQRRPADHKTDVRTDGFLRVGIGGTGFRELTHQFAVADGGEQHPGQRQQIRRRYVAIADAGDDAEGIKHRHRRQIGQPHHHHLPEFEGFTQAWSARLSGVMRRKINSHRPFPPCC